MDKDLLKIIAAFCLVSLTIIILTAATGGQTGCCGSCCNDCCGGCCCGCCGSEEDSDGDGLCGQEDTECTGNTCGGGCEEGYKCNGGYCIPAAKEEICGNTEDEDCIGGANAGIAGNSIGDSQYQGKCDNDGDGFAYKYFNCDPSGTLDCSDCDDNNINVFPEQTEVCDEKDDNCDSLLKEDINGVQLVETCDFRDDQGVIQSGQRECVSPAWVERDESDPEPSSFWTDCH
jgi:hypothetical protein